MPFGCLAEGERQVRPPQSERLVRCHADSDIRGPAASATLPVGLRAAGSGVFLGRRVLRPPVAFSPAMPFVSLLRCWPHQPAAAEGFQGNFSCREFLPQAPVELLNRLISRTFHPPDQLGNYLILFVW